MPVKLVKRDNKVCVAVPFEKIRVVPYIDRDNKQRVKLMYSGTQDDYYMDKDISIVNAELDATTGEAYVPIS